MTRLRHKFHQLSKHELVTSGSFLMLANLSSTITNFCLVYILANFIDQSTYGTYKYILSVFGLLSITTLPGIGIAVVRSVSRGYGGSLQLAVKKKMTYGLIGSTASAVIAGYYFWQGNEVLAACFMLAAIAVPLVNSFTIYRSYLNGTKQYRKIAIETAIVNLLLLLLIGSTLLLTDNIIYILSAYFFGHFFFNFLMYQWTIQSEKTNQTIDHDLFTYGKHLTVLKSIGNATGYLQSIAVWHILGAAALPVYALAAAPLEQIRPILKSAQSILLPKMAHDDWQTRDITWFIKKTAPYLSCLLAITIMYIVVAESIFSLLFPRYLEAVIYSQILAVGLVFTALNIVLSSILQAKRQVKKLYINKITAIIIDILSLAFLYFYGLFGLVIVTVVKKAILSVITIGQIYYQK